MEVTIRSYERRDAAGVADVFYRSVREVALSDYTPEQVRATEASELARRFFERKGFTLVERQDMILRGVPIHNYRMVKTLG